MMTLNPKPVFDLSAKTPCTLDGAAMLAALCEISNEGDYGPAPLGRYNRSVSRLLGRVERYARNLRSHLKHRLVAPTPNSETISSIAEEMEALIYACTEHAETVKGILGGCGISKKEKEYRPLFNAWKDATDLLDEMTNTMKHQEARCRFHTVHIRHGEIFLPLHGFFVEGYKDNALGPHPVVHRDHPVYSVTWLAWRAIELVLVLNMLMHSSITQKFGVLPLAKTDRPELRSAISEAVRLPAYSFGEAHFLTTSHPAFILSGGARKDFLASQPCYGSIYYPWVRDQVVALIGGATMHVADGQTRSFQMVSPKSAVLIDWKMIVRPE